MQLLLTSNGLTNESLRKIFLDLLPDPQESTVAFITTASNGEKDRSHLDDSIEILKSMEINHVNPIDIGKEKETWEETLKEADIVYVEGGNTFYLMDKLRKSGLDTTLKDILEDKLYVGVSAGSIVVTPDISIATVEHADPNEVGLTDMKGLGLVDFEVSPHTPDSVSYKKFQEYANSHKRLIYGFDDQTALFVQGDDVRVVGDGVCKMLNIN